MVEKRRNQAANNALLANQKTKTRTKTNTEAKRGNAEEGRTFGVDRLVWTHAARKEEEVPWYTTGVLLRAERFMASWHKSQEESSRLREVNQAANALLANQKTKTKTKTKTKAKR